jgi:nitroreductase
MEVVMIQNAVTDAILARRSTRAFETRQIPPEYLNTLLEAAVWAPSGGNNQTWLFTAIQKPDVLRKLHEMVRDAFVNRYVPDDEYPGKHGVIEAAKSESFNCFYNAPTLIVASNRPNYENAMADCSLALENIFLTAQSLGLGSCYINQLHWLRGDGPIRAYLAELGIPKEHTICSAAAVGYGAKPSPTPPRKAGTKLIIK